MADMEPASQTPVSRRRVARDITEMMRKPCPNTRLIPGQDSLRHACLLLDTGTRVIHVSLVFPNRYPDHGPDLWITGRRMTGRIDDHCVDLITAVGVPSPAYTIKMLAIHLSSMFGNEYELKAVNTTGQVWALAQWQWAQNDYFEKIEDWQCGCGWHPWVHRDIVHQDADEFSAPNNIGATGILQPMVLQKLPDELLTRVLELMEVEDIVRFGQAYKKVASIINQDVLIRERELRCFVTKEHYKQSSLGIGICLPPLNQQAGVCIVSEFDLISSDAFLNLGVRNAAYGCKFSHWLPLPLSEKHWDRVKDEAYRTLNQLAHDVNYQGMADGMDVLTAFMEDQVIKLFTSEAVLCPPDKIGPLRASEKGIEGLFFIFHLMLCLAVDNPEYVTKANRMITDFQSADDADLKDMPTPGRLLAALLISDVETDFNFLRTLFWEAVTRNVPQLLMAHDELGYLEYARSPYRVHHTFMNDRDRYRSIMFLDLFQRTVRAADLGKPKPGEKPATSADILKARRDFLFQRRGFPPSALLAALAAEVPRVKDVDSLHGLFQYMRLYSYSVHDHFLAQRLRETVSESFSRRGRTSWFCSREEGAAVRLAAEEQSPLPETEYLRPIPGLSAEMDHEFKELLARHHM